MSDSSSILFQIEDNDPTLSDLFVAPGGEEWSQLDVEADGNWERVGIAIGKNTCLKEINFCLLVEINVRDVVDLWQGLANNRSINHLSIGVFEDPSLPEEVPPLMASLIENNSNISTLIIYNWSKLSFEALVPAIGSRTSLQDIQLSDIRFSPKLFSHLLKLLGGLPQLEKLEIKYIYLEDSDVEDSSWFADIACLLGNENLKLVELVLGFINLDLKQLFASVSKGLECNKSLKTLFLEYDACSVDLNPGCWDTFKHSLQLYNDSILEFHLGRGWGSLDHIPREISSLLELNGWEDKELVRFRKGLDYDFLRPEHYFNGKPFGEDFEITLLPYVLSSIGNIRSVRDQRNEIYRRSALFHFIRNLPKLVLQKYDGKTSAVSKT